MSREKQNEFDRFFQNYSNDKYLNIHFFGEFNKVKFVEDLINYSEDFSNVSPDILSYVNEEIYMMEHFTFDASSTYPNHGSIFEANKNKTEKMIANNQNNSKKMSGSIPTHNSKENAFNNLKYSFLDHCNKYNTYKTNVLNKYKNYKGKIHFGLLIEETTMFGGILENGGVFNILETKDFQDLWNSNPYVEYIFFRVSNANNSPCYLIFYDDYKNFKGFKCLENITVLYSQNVNFINYTIKII